MSKKPKIPVPITDIEAHFTDQLEFIARAMRDFDAGSENEYKRMATALRVLLHTSRTSHALVDQVKLSAAEIPSYAKPINPRNLVSEFSLAMIRHTDETVVFAPLLDQGPIVKRMLPIGAWKDEQVLRDQAGNHFTRWALVIAVANQDGGSHVDPDMDEDYYNLSRKNSVGWKYGTEGNYQDIGRIEKVYLRHIAWEAHSGLSTAWSRSVGNRGCACGSGRKGRYCCQKV